MIKEVVRGYKHFKQNYPSIATSLLIEQLSDCDHKTKNNLQFEAEHNMTKLMGKPYWTVEDELVLYVCHIIRFEVK